MGFMTEICILNDHWDELERLIREEPEKLIRELRTLMNGRPRYGPRDPVTDRREYLGSDIAGDIRGTQFKMYRSHHADEPRLYLAHENMFVALDEFSLESEFGNRLGNPNDHLLKVIERDVGLAETIIRSAKKYLSKKRDERSG